MEFLLQAQGKAEPCWATIRTAPDHHGGQDGVLTPKFKLKGTHNGF